MPARAPDPSAGEVSPELTALVARLREAGIAPGVEELADALWLARWLPGPSEAAPQGADGTGDLTTTPDGGPDTTAISVPQPGPVTPTVESEQQDRAGLFAPGAGGERAAVRMTPVRVPAAPALPEPLALQRALRPLQRYRAPVRPVPRTLDEQATAERAAESGLVLPVLRADRRREARLLLVMDVSTSMAVWQQALDELRQVCERAGAFREVRMQYLHETAEGLPGLAATPERTGPLHAPEQLSDPTGRRLTLVLSDCAGPMWRSGRMQQLLHRWAATAPVAVVQPLPQRMWTRTHLPARRGVLHRREGPAGTLGFTPEKGRVDPAAAPIPVLALRRGSVEGWARLLSGARGQSLTAAAGWVRADHAASIAPVRAAQDLSAEERVRVFRRNASREARRLAVHLSAVPLYLPVMQLVQHAMLAGTGPEVLSEVLLGGLVRRRDDADDPQAVRYEFLPGVAPRLRERLAVDEAELLFKHLSDYVERKFGRSVRNFPAMAGAFLRGAVDPGPAPVADPRTDVPEPAGLRAFAEVSADVLRDLGARIPAAPELVPTLPAPNARELLSRGREAIGRYETQGSTRELDAAVEYLRQAVEAARSGKERASAAEELANALLSRWRVRGVGEDLRDAWEAVGDGPVTGRACLIRGTVCWLQSREASRVGVEFAGIPDSLREWARGVPDGTAHAQAVLLYLADRDLTLVLDDAETTPDALDRRRIAAETLVHVRRAVARSTLLTEGQEASVPVPDPEQRYLAHLHRAIEAAGTRIQFPEPEGAHALRGALWFEVAQHYAGSGPATARPHPERASLAAERAVEDLLVAVRDETVLPSAERCRIWLTVAASVEILQPPREDGRERRLMMSAVEQALAAAGDDEALLLDCHLWAARVYRDRFERTGDLAHLDRAVEAWTAADSLLGEDDAQQREVLTEFGVDLLRRGEATGSAEDVNRAVQLLRTAVEETPSGDPRLAERQRQLALAHWRRFSVQGVLSDLYEAEWILGAAIHGSAEGAHEFLARCRLQRGRVCEALHARTGDVGHLYNANNHYANAFSSAQAASMPELTAEVLMSRGRVRESLGEADVAVRHYAQALELTEDPDRARDLRSALARLNPETAPE
ncbi:SAV_2336 N-terminal domain-related protein [Streptomyces guryensis]|uniref:Metallophosphoesterase n=1 Tax=Streptomyces guryensis TaxID=2886947 RepID=A0A9Q3VVA5_9ACTN|nr:SAV_2336 N-terminal domain-related protein [Streptomyces guryensis]MCD9878018.1 metallophosphoesterase [Streptomyces guryensis]